MLYDDFINELLNWQGVFDNFSQSPGAYKEYFRLISEKVKDIDTLRFCLEKHQEDRNKFFPKPFEINDYADEFVRILKNKLFESPFYKEILELKDTLRTQKDHVLYVKKNNDPEGLKKIESYEKTIEANENKLKELEEKRRIALNTKRIE